MRKPEPWYWGARKGWYVQINKKQVKLGDEPNPRANPKPPPDVMREYYRLMASEGLITAKERVGALVPEVCEAYLATKSKLKKLSYETVVWCMRLLCIGNMKKAFASVKSGDIEKIADSQKTWGDTTKHDFVGQITTLFDWAKEAGYTQFNALAGYDNPYVKQRRERLLTDEEFRAIMDCSHDLQFKQIMMFMRATGCRPGEARIATAAHIHPDLPLVILNPKEHKTGHRTKRKRVLLMPEETNVMVRALMRQYPKGPLFRNSRNGQGWGRVAIPQRFRNYRRRLGLGEDVVPYLIRHAAATRWVETGTDLALVAKMMGHVGTSTLQSTYFHPDVSKMLAAAEKGHVFKKPPKPKAPGESSSSSA